MVYIYQIYIIIKIAFINHRKTICSVNYIVYYLAFDKNHRPLVAFD